VTGALDLAGPSDIEAIWAIERTEGYAPYVGRWEREAHRAEMERPGSLYLVWREDGRVAGFVLLQNLDDLHGTAYLKRMAMAMAVAGRGAGTAFLKAVVDWVFANTATHRLELHTVEHNHRARRCYEKAGFLTEGLLRDRFRDGDGWVSAWLMAVIRP
jgi:RimJ/RimL family protein N-acetyltransferase